LQKFQIPGRIADLAKKPPPEPSSGSESDDERYDEAKPESKRPTVKRSPLTKATAVSVDEPPLQLFGPPPVQQKPDVFAQSMSRIDKKREQVNI
jgi:hypothetical protein